MKIFPALEATSLRNQNHDLHLLDANRQVLGTVEDHHLPKCLRENRVLMHAAVYAIILDRVFQRQDTP